MASKRFVFLTIIELIVIAYILTDLFVLSKTTPEVRLANWETEANLPVIGKREYYDVVMLGTSHARIFSRYQNHERVEKALDRKFINLSQGGERGGVRNQQVYLDYFLRRRNTAETLVYFVDPFVFYRSSLDNNEKIYINEPYRKDFASLLKQVETDTKKIDFYNTKDSRGIQPIEYPEFDKTYQETQSGTPSLDAINERIQFLYTDDYNKVKFDETLRVLMGTITKAKNEGMRVIVIVPTTQLPEQLGDKYVLEALKEESNKGDFEYYNYSHIISDTAMYYDTDHLNTEGIVFFTKQYLKPILDK